MEKYREIKNVNPGEVEYNTASILYSLYYNYKHYTYNINHK